MAALAGLTKAQLQAAFGIDAAIDISTFNALADALNKGASGPGLAVLKVSVSCFKTLFTDITGVLRVMRMPEFRKWACFWVNA